MVKKKSTSKRVKRAVIYGGAGAAIYANRTMIWNAVRGVWQRIPVPYRYWVGGAGLGAAAYANKTRLRRVFWASGKKKAAAPRKKQMVYEEPIYEEHYTRR